MSEITENKSLNSEISRAKSSTITDILMIGIVSFNFTTITGTTKYFTFYIWSHGFFHFPIDFLEKKKERK